jgi:NTP pyrophosphatase (non-canonical NTP hydrolase)
MSRDTSRPYDLPESLTFNGYQAASRATAIYPGQGANYVYPTLGLVSEAGEVADRIKRIERDDGGMVTNQKRIEVSSELGDVLWYVAQLATEFGLELSDIAAENLAKLERRQDDGTLGGYGQR